MIVVEKCKLFMVLHCAFEMNSFCIGNPYVTSLGPDTSAMLGWKSIMAKTKFTNKKYHFIKMTLAKVERNWKRLIFCFDKEFQINLQVFFLKMNWFIWKSKQAQSKMVAKRRRLWLVVLNFARRGVISLCNLAVLGNHYEKGADFELRPWPSWANVYLLKEILHRKPKGSSQTS